MHAAQADLEIDLRIERYVCINSPAHLPTQRAREWIHDQRRQPKMSFLSGGVHSCNYQGETDQGEQKHQRGYWFSLHFLPYLAELKKQWQR